ncbi:MAG: hypothetical protein JO081_03300 [Alphaproteobacteria bacterium]|nr:hypothetical protein [Alphaproteobacteria bacterium]
MDAVPLLLRFKRRMPPASDQLRYDETAAVSMLEEDGKRVPFVATYSVANLLFCPAPVLEGI